MTNTNRTAAARKRAVARELFAQYVDRRSTSRTDIDPATRIGAAAVAERLRVELLALGVNPEALEVTGGAR